MIERIKNFFIGVRSELGKVTWPGRKELVASSIIVITLVLIIATYIGIVDVLLAWLLKIVVR